MGRTSVRKTTDKLYQHASGHWAKRIRGKVHYFGRDLDAALIRWRAEKEFLLAGLTVRPEASQARETLKTLCTAVLTQKQSLADAGQFSLRTLRDYQFATKRLLSFFGPDRFLHDLRPADFVPFRSQCAADVSPITCGNRLRYVRAILKYAFDAELVEKPIRFGTTLSLPSQSLLRAERNRRGEKMFSASEIRLLLNGGTVTDVYGNSTEVAEASPVLRAMILLGINCGFGQGDISQLTLDRIDLENGWHTFPRPKTGMPRRCSLFPETISAIRDYLTVRPSPVDVRHSNRLFLTQHGGEFITITGSGTPETKRINVIDYVAKSFEKRLHRLKLKRKGIGFYTLRHTFRTIGDNLKDQPTIDYCMGHSPSSNDMAANYRHTIDDLRFRDISQYIRQWLFAIREH